MARLSFDRVETALLADVVETCRKADDWPVPFLLLDHLGDLLHADSVSFSLFDTALEFIPFARAVGPDGPEDDGETITQARQNPFWDLYWKLPAPSYPDRSGDYRSVNLASDFGSRAARRARIPAGTPLGSMQGCFPGRAPGRHYRIVAWRFGASPDFGERERLALALLRPHIEQGYWRQVAASHEPPPLTRRQLELLEWVRQGLTNRQIARRLELSEATVRTHLNHIYERLGTSGRTAAVHAVFGPSEDWPRGA